MLDKRLENDNATMTHTKFENKIEIQNTECTNFVDDADIEKKSGDLELSSVKKSKEKTQLLKTLDDILGVVPQRMRNEVLIEDQNLEFLLTLEKDEKREELDETKESMKFGGKADDKGEDKHYEEKEDINKEMEKKTEAEINNDTICLSEGLKKATKNEKDTSKETNGEIGFLCPLCKRDLPLFGDGCTVKLEECHHILCRFCMTELLKSIIADPTIQPICPYNDCLIQCNSLIQEHEIRELVEPKLYEEYLEKLIVKMKEDAGNRILHCQTPTCKAWYIIEDNNVNQFFCTLCKVNNYVYMEANKKQEETLADTETYILSERYNEMLLLSESDIVPNFESFECPICFVQYNPQEGLILKNCLHTFCKICIANVISYSEDADVKCPYKNDDYACDETILQSEIRAVLKPDDYQNYLQKSVVQAERKAGKSAFHCRTPNCPAWCFYESDVDHFLCPTCKEDNCFICQKIHTGMGCAGNASPEENTDAISKKSISVIEIMLESGNALPCPTCNIIISKVDGCDAVTCPSCKTEICWVTRGPRWGPKGRGDKSGGCRCETFYKCHPNCRNCH